MTPGKVRITWRCGHGAEYPRSEMPTSPVCQQCGERVVQHVVGAQPTFKGACSGPLVSQ